MDREKAIAFVEGYGRTWQAWDYEGFADLFTDDAVYVEHPTDETVVGRDQLLDYIRREHEAEGVASVHMGSSPVVEGERVVGEFWTTMTKPGEIATLIGCFVARLDEATGRCLHFRQYWHEVHEGVATIRGLGRVERGALTALTIKHPIPA